MFALTTISLVQFITTAFNIVALLISWRRRKTKVGFYFALGMWGVTLWTLAAGFDYAAVPIPLKVFFAKLEYTGYNFAFVFFVLFAVCYAGYERWTENLSARVFFGFVLMSNVLLAWTNDWHRWLWSSFERSPYGDNIVVFEHGPGYLWAVVTGYLMILAIIVPLWQASRHGSEFSRRQARLLFYAALVPLLGNLSYVLEPARYKGLDWTSLFFSISGILFLLALYGTRFLDIVPIARDQLVSSLSDAMIVLDTQNRIIDLNPAAAALLGFSIPELIGKDLPPFASLSRSYLDQPLDQEIRTELETGAGTKRYFDVLLSPLHGDRKTIIGRLLLFRDISHHKENELRLLQLTQAVEQSPASVMITDREGKITYVNPHFTVLTGYSPVEIIGKDSSIVQSGSTPEEVYQEMWRAIRSGQTWRGEFLNRRKNGELYWENTVIAPLVDQDGQILNFIAIQEDITQRKRAEDDLRNANNQLEERLKEIETLQASLREQAIRDPLTQLHNRRFLDESIEQEFHHAKRASEPLSIILLDIDNFKLINDTYGHAVGDACLVAMADLLQGYVRRSDISCRYGGEEFMLVLPATSLEGATQFAEKLRQIVARKAFIVDGQELRFTISLGIASYPAHGEASNEIINKADDALYISKRLGRNRATVWSAANHIQKPYRLSREE